MSLRERSLPRSPLRPRRRPSCWSRAHCLRGPLPRPVGLDGATVAVGDQICVNKAAYGLRVPACRVPPRGAGPRAADVVVLTSPTDGEVLLKRVVAVPGDVVEVSSGQVAIDGAVAAVRTPAAWSRRWAARHALSAEYGGGPDFGPTLVPRTRYLVLGDSRGNSRDGRYFGWVSRGRSWEGGGGVPARRAGVEGAVTLGEGRPGPGEGPQGLADVAPGRAKVSRAWLRSPWAGRRSPGLG